jgi:uncharacterized protein YbjT (DUF2867 family)
MSGKTAAIIGVTGMTGNYLLSEMFNDPYYETIRVIVRRPYAKSDPRIEVKLVDFNDYESLKLAIDGSHALFSNIGTTQKKVKGDKEQYRKIDFDIPVKAARACKETGCEVFVTITSVGASSKSRNFYLKLKGEVEDALGNSGVRSVQIMQPSMLLGDRKENRIGEQVGTPVMTALSFLMLGSLKKYKPIHGRDVAKAMLAVSKKGVSGIFRYTYGDIKSLTR